jgi:hypothetical protein
MTRWTTEEINFIKQTSHLHNQEAYKQFCEAFPGKRAPQAFAGKRSKLGLCQASSKKLKWKAEWLAFIDTTKGQKTDEAYKDFVARFPESDITLWGFRKQRSRSGASDKKPHGTNKRAALFEERTKGGYVMIKIAEPDKWISKARYVYQNAHPEEEIEKNAQFYFLDRNNRNFDPANIIKVDARERTIFMLEGGVADDPAETRLHLAMAKLRLAQLDLGEKIGDVIDYGAGRKTKEEHRSHSAEYARKNRKKVREQAKSYYERIKEEGGERWKRHQEQHKEAARKWAQNNRKK